MKLARIGVTEASRVLRSSRGGRGRPAQRATMSRYSPIGSAESSTTFNLRWLRRDNWNASLHPTELAEKPVLRYFYERPADLCERSGNWWDPQARECGTVVYIPDVTGRYVMGGQRVTSGM